MVALAMSTAYIGLNELKHIDPAFDTDDKVLIRYEMVREYLVGPQSGEKIAIRCGYSPTQLYMWAKRFSEKGILGLVDEKTGPKGPIKATEDMEQRILQLREQQDLTITEISAVLKEEGTPLGPTTVDKVLTKNGVAKKKRGRKPKNRNR